jgi:hypothetical protein
MYSQNSETCYIGQTCRGYMRRYLTHISQAKLGKVKAYRNNWIRSVINNGDKVEIIRLMEVENKEQADFYETFFIELLTLSNIKLCNLSGGGGGIVGFKFSEESNKKRSESLRRTFRLNPRKWSDERKEDFQRKRLYGLIWKPDKKLADEASERFKGNTYRKGLEPVNKGKRKLTREQVSKIEEDLKSGLSTKEIIEKYKTNPTTISCIRNNKYFDSCWGYKPEEWYKKQRERVYQ